MRRLLDHKKLSAPRKDEKKSERGKVAKKKYQRSSSTIVGHTIRNRVLLKPKGRKGKENRNANLSEDG